MSGTSVLRNGSSTDAQRLFKSSLTRNERVAAQACDFCGLGRSLIGRERSLFRRLSSGLSLAIDDSDLLSTEGWTRRTHPTARYKLGYNHKAGPGGSGAAPSNPRRLGLQRRLKTDRTSRRSISRLRFVSIIANVRRETVGSLIKLLYLLFVTL